ncbi:MAG TPA: riboflavin synthase [Armatimonadota bacterium]|jgi:riboflavin synthase
MFTGIIEELGTVVSVRREANVARLTLQAQIVRDDLRVGDSLATNGVCLTVERIEPSQLLLTMMPETLRRTTLGLVHPGDRVNLERAVPVGGRLGGHILSGHVDGQGTLTRVSGTGEERVYTFTMPQELSRFIAAQGSIAVDGISLTIVDVAQETFSVSLIRHTLGMTTLAFRTPGSPVNLEVDQLARYLDRLLSARGSQSDLTLDRLRELGY